MRSRMLGGVVVTLALTGASAASAATLGRGAAFGVTRTPVRLAGRSAATNQSAATDPAPLTISGPVMDAAAASGLVDPLEKLRYKLLRDFPETFGGIYQANDGGFDVVEVGTNAAFVSETTSGFSNFAQSMANGSSITPTLHVVPGVRAYSQLVSTRNAITANWASAVSAGVYSVGFNDQSGTLVLGETGSQSATAYVSALQSKYGKDMFTLLAGPAPKPEYGRYTDALPWFGGDQMVDFNGNLALHSCTSGFGMMNTGTGNTFILTAGHCDDAEWYNEKFNPPPAPIASQIMGHTISSSVYTSGEDIGLIDALPWCIVWGGQSTNNSNLVDRYITNYLNPPLNANVLLDGSNSPFEHSATVTSYNTQFTENGHTINGVDIANGATSLGDSGGPVEYPSQFGYLAGGSILAGNGISTWFQLIDVPIFVYTSQYGNGHAFTVVTSPNGSNC